MTGMLHPCHSFIAKIHFKHAFQQHPDSHAAAGYLKSQGEAVTVGGARSMA